METRTIKISSSNYKWICEYAGELQKKMGEPVSINKALTFLTRRSKLSDLAGSWVMTDHEVDVFMKKIRKGWSEWKIKSV